MLKTLVTVHGHVYHASLVVSIIGLGAQLYHQRSTWSSEVENYKLTIMRYYLFLQHRSETLPVTSFHVGPFYKTYYITFVLSISKKQTLNWSWKKLTKLISCLFILIRDSHPSQTGKQTPFKRQDTPICPSIHGASGMQLSLQGEPLPALNGILTLLNGRK